MRRRLNRDDLSASSPVAASIHQPSLRLLWTVYDEYGRSHNSDGETCLVVPANAQVANRYEPLVNTPYLFLEFARIVEGRDRVQALYDWTFRRGLLGMDNNSDRGGDNETPDEIWAQALQANNLLTMYEAALSRDLHRLKKIFGLGAEGWLGGDMIIPLFGYELGPLGLGHQQEPMDPSASLRDVTDTRDLKYLRVSLDLKQIDNVDLLAEIAVRIVIDLVQQALATLVRPTFGTLSLNPEDTTNRWWEPELLTRSWLPLNLLGAMYLQFYWMMTSSGDLTRCKYCGQIISRASSVSRNGRVRKPRSDRKFCTSQCRQNYHYHNRIKPVREKDQA
jgi:hypothetical protein